MRLAVLSDIHANLEAFQAVLADLERAGADRLAFLGDVVGYGPDPEECVRLARGLGLAGVMGNHELGLAEASSLGWFNPIARRSLLQTREMLSAESLDYLIGLPLFLVQDGVRLVHGAPPDSATTYYFELGDQEIRDRLGDLPEGVCLVGHTHELHLARLYTGKVERLPLGQGLHRLEPGWRYLINAGAVGQPRDGDNRAKYVIYDEPAATLEVRLVDYDIPTTMRKIRERGLPEFNATRLL
ncbi:MAG: metallophosphoesterase [Desulfarculus sp.]|nr:MAG: metallophosphoesterase [Desulfarculus sp.]